MADESMTEQDLSDLISDMFPVLALPDGGADPSVDGGKELLAKSSESCSRQAVLGPTGS
jgi:hypothetical protein